MNKSIAAESIRQAYAKLSGQRLTTHLLMTDEVLAMAKEKCVSNTGSESLRLSLYGTPFESFSTMQAMFARKAELELKGYLPRCITLGEAIPVLVPGESMLDIFNDPIIERHRNE